MGFIFNDPKFIIGTNDIPSPIQMFKSFVIGGAVNEPTWQDVVISGVGAITLVNAQADSLEYLKLFGKCQQGDLPDGYTRVEYLQSNGTQGVYIPYYRTYGHTYKLVLDVEAISYNYNPVASLGADYKGYSIVARTINGVTGYGFDTNNYFAASGRVTLTLICSADGKTSTLSDGISTITNVRTDYNYAFRPSLFEQHTNSRGSAKIYSAQFYEDDVLLYNLIPAIHTSGRGLYNTVNGQFLLPYTGTLTSGSVVTPTPDNPMPIWCNNGQISLFYGNKFTRTGQSTGYLINTSSGALDSNSSYNTTDYIFLKAGKYTYTYKDTVASSGRVFRGYLYSLTDKSPVALAFSRSVSTANTVLSYNFTIQSDYYIRVSYRNSMSNTTMSVTDTILYVDNPVTETVEDSLGNTATAVNLLGVSSTYRDEQEILTGAVKNKIGVYLCTGTEDWTLVSTSYSDGTRRIWCDLDVGVGNVGLSNMFTIAPMAQRDDDNMNNRFFLNTSTLHLRSDKFTSLANAKTWLTNQYNAGTPVIIYYVLPTATTKTVTAQTMNVAEGENTITITQSAIDGLGLEAKYKAGVRVTITEVENANLDNQVTVTIT